VARFVALVIIAVWLGLLGWLATHTSKPEVEWARLLTVLSSLEAVAFAAAGAMFGTTIQRNRVEEAKDRAAKAEDRAANAESRSLSNEQAAANGRALATAIKNRAGGKSQSGIERLSAAKPDPAVEELSSLARSLFPD
jgi:hypothetical protein